MLTLIPTPIGNLNDISIRSLLALYKAKVVLAEDTRVAKKLYSLLESKNLFKCLEALDFFTDSINFDSNRTFLAFHSHNQKEFLENLDSSFFDDEIVFISDAGMPCLCDSGALLVKFAKNNNKPFSILPGSNAALLAYAFSGSEVSEFYFGGFLPHKLESKTFKIKESLESNTLSIFYESPHRILETLQLLTTIENLSNLFVIKEMTKLHEKFYEGSAQSVYDEVKNANTNGEWVIVLESSNKIKRLSLDSSEILSLPLPLKVKAKMLSKISDKDSKAIYKELLEKQ